MPVRALLRYVARHRTRYLAGFALLGLTNLLALAVPWVVKNTIEAVTGGASPRAVAAGASLVVALAIGQGLTRIASRLALLGASQRVESAIRADLFRHLLRLPAVFYQRQRTGDLMSRATNDLQGVAMLSGFGILSLVNTLMVYAGTLVALLRIDPTLTLVALAPYPLLVAAGKRFNATVHGQTLAMQEQLARLSSKVQENLAGAAVVRAYTMEEREIAAFRSLNREYLARVLRLVRTQGLFSGAMGVMGGFGTLIVLWLGGRAVIEGRLTLGAFVAFGSYLAYLAWPTIALGWVLALVRRGLSAMDRIVQVLEIPPAVSDGPEAVAGPPLGGDVEVRDLTFAYEAGRPPALRGVSLRIPAGAWVAVVGGTGAGKTTLVSLLVRLWDPPPGSVFLDGREIHTIPLADLRGAVGFVPQEPFLFSRSLLDNVGLGADRARVERAGQVAGLNGDVARLPAGWATVVGERGQTLSGGQRQRATLARALCRDPRLLILDDAFASVDAEREAEILAALRAASGGWTAIVVTHRLRAAEVADWVVVMEEGRVVEQGTHETLLGQGGPYARLWRRQALEARLEAAR